MQSEVWGGRAFNLDEAYEFWDGLGLLASGRGEGDKERAPTVHASTLHTLIGGGKTRRATRTSTSFGESGRKRVSVSLFGERAPSQVHGNGPGNRGQPHCVRHRPCDPAPRSALQAASPNGRCCPSRPSRRGNSAGWRCWTRQQLHRPRAWRGTMQRARRRQHLLRLAPSWASWRLQRGIPRWRRIPAPIHACGFAQRWRRAGPNRVLDFSHRGDPPDPTERIQKGAERVAQLFSTKPQAILPFDNEARKVMMATSWPRAPALRRAAGRSPRTFGRLGSRGRRRLLQPTVRVASHYHRSRPVRETLVGHKHRHTGHQASSS